MDALGNAYVAGGTNATNFPQVNSVQPAYAGGPYDAIVAKISPSGSALIYSRYVGGSGLDAANGVAVDGSGSVYLAGTTSSSNFPTLNAPYPALAGATDAFILKLTPSGSAFVYSTFLGGSGGDEIRSVKVDNGGSAYVTGITLSPNFPTTPAAFSSVAGGGEDVFVAKLNSAGTALEYSTYLATSGDERGLDIAVDLFGSAYVVGSTTSAGSFPTLNALQPSRAGSQDAFVTKLNATGSGLIYSTYLGGNSFQLAQGVAVDSSGNAYVMGYTLLPISQLRTRFKAHSVAASTHL